MKIIVDSTKLKFGAIAGFLYNADSALVENPITIHDGKYKMPHEEKARADYEYGVLEITCDICRIFPSAAEFAESLSILLGVNGPGDEFAFIGIRTFGEQEREWLNKALDPESWYSGSPYSEEQLEEIREGSFPG